MNMETAGLSSW